MRLCVNCKHVVKPIGGKHNFCQHPSVATDPVTGAATRELCYNIRNSLTDACGFEKRIEPMWEK